MNAPNLPRDGSRATPATVPHPQTPTIAEGATFLRASLTVLAAMQAKAEQLPWYQIPRRVLGPTSPSGDFSRLVDSIVSRVREIGRILTENADAWENYAIAVAFYKRPQIDGVPPEVARFKRDHLRGMAAALEWVATNLLTVPHASADSFQPFSSLLAMLDAPPYDAEADFIAQGAEQREEGARS